MKSKEEIKQLAEEFTNGHYHYRGKDVFIHAYTKCQEDMSRKEIQPEDIWNKESQDKIKEHILNRANNQSSEDIIKTELAAKKYTEEDMLKAFEKGALYGSTKNGNIHYFDEVINSLNKQD